MAAAYRSGMAVADKAFIIANGRAIRHPRFIDGRADVDRRLDDGNLPRVMRWSDP
jgi:hypothetical protein